MHAHNLLKNDWSLGTYVGFRDVLHCDQGKRIRGQPTPHHC